MQKQVVSAIFETLESAERAVTELRGTGIPDEAISVVTLRLEEDHSDDGVRRTEALRQRHDGKATGVIKGAAAGGAVGAVAGLAALVIPGLGPFIAAGAIGEAFGVAGSALITSGAVGATAGGLTGALVDYGISRAEAEEIERRIRQGATLVTVETLDSPGDHASARAVLRAAGGETAEFRSDAKAEGEGWR